MGNQKQELTLAITQLAKLCCESIGIRLEEFKTPDDILVTPLDQGASYYTDMDDLISSAWEMEVGYNS